MKTAKVMLFVVLIVVIFTLFAQQVSAVAAPTFPACSNPIGSVKASYDTGTHGVVGDTTSYTGRDTVYQLDENTLMQCLCTSDGKGIQTNWWKVSSLTDDQISILTNQGWTLVRNGKVWGLQDSSYLAYNTNYSCGSSTNTGGLVLGLSDTGSLPIFILSIFGIVLLASGVAISQK